VTSSWSFIRQLLFISYIYKDFSIVATHKSHSVLKTAYKVLIDVADKTCLKL